MFGEIILSKLISDVIGRMVYDSRGRPTVEVEIIIDNKLRARAIAPSGASKGGKEAFELRDMEKTHDGFGVNKAVSNVNGLIKKNLIGLDVRNQKLIDKTLIQIDGTKNKSSLGANSIIATSMAVLKTAAVAENKELWEYLNIDSDDSNLYLPMPEIQIFGGGAHARNSIDIQDIMIVPNNAKNFNVALEWVANVYNTTRTLLEEKNLLSGVADEGGFWPNFKSNEEAIQFVVKSIEKAGYRPKEDISISLDIAANNFYKNKKYYLRKSNNVINSDELIEIILKWVKKFPICSIEDPFAEEDISSFYKLKKSAPSYLQIVGDDLIATNKENIIYASKKDSVNSILIKPNQIGTITETFEALGIANKNKLTPIMSARSGESEDTTIVDLCIGLKIPQLKVGSIVRSERLAKWNKCLRIGEKLSNKFLMSNKSNIIY